MTGFTDVVVDNTMEAAGAAAREFKDSGSRSVIVEWAPGDMTVYRFLIHAPTPSVVLADVGTAPSVIAPTNSDAWIVVNLAGSGHWHPWDGRAVDDFSASDRWWPGNEHAGRVIALFLRSFATVLEAAP